LWFEQGHRWPFFFAQAFAICNVPKVSDPLKTFDSSNLSPMNQIADICNFFKLSST
jgi:hypothetical protein